MLYQPNGQPFLSFLEVHQRAEQAELERQRIELERQRTELELQSTTFELQSTTLELQSTTLELQQAQQNLQLAASRLLALGLGVEEVAATVGLPIAMVQAIVDQAGD